VFVADVLGAIFAYGAIQTALLQRARSGAGQHVDVLPDGLDAQPPRLRAAGGAVSR
jgi:crotonobetainyl-CoA:carnitine CoA-transferase CaiB-like acyl-CoA transferase